LSIYQDGAGEGPPEVTEPQRLPPTVMRVLLGNELTRLRERAGVTQLAAANALRCSQSKIAHVEAGVGIRALELDALLDLYHVEDSDRAYATDLQREANRRTKRGAFSTRFRQHMRLMVDMEPHSRTRWSYNATVIPGLLQTEDFMRMLFRTWRPSPAQDLIDQDTTDRLARQKILENTDQKFWFIIDEAALRRATGNRSIMGDQIRRLVEAIDLPNVDVQVVPFSAGYYIGQSHDYVIFSFDTKTPVSIVYLENHDGGEYIDDGKRTQAYLTVWEQQHAAAFGPEQSRRMLLDILDSV
jgi:transcriptional regulator with XRE-family HTH domain